MWLGLGLLVRFMVTLSTSEHLLYWQRQKPSPLEIASIAITRQPAARLYQKKNARLPFSGPRLLPTASQLDVTQRAPLGVQPAARPGTKKNARLPFSGPKFLPTGYELYVVVAVNTYIPNNFIYLHVIFYVLMCPLHMYVLSSWTYVCCMGIQSQSHFTIGRLAPISSSWRQAPWDSRPEFFFQLNSCGNSPYVTSLWREDGFVSYEYAWPYSMLLKFFIFHYKEYYTIFTVCILLCFTICKSDKITVTTTKTSRFIFIINITSLLHVSVSQGPSSGNLH
jgi:hypothetical protein